MSTGAPVQGASQDYGYPSYSAPNMPATYPPAGAAGDDAYDNVNTPYPAQEPYDDDYGVPAGTDYNY
jgi:hypothetical protein